MKIIGIVTRKSKSLENHNINVLYNDVVNLVKKNKAIPIGLVLEEDYKELINICDGIIFQGGDDIEEIDLKALKYAYDLDIPVLGICLGMQEMGVLFNGHIEDIDNHKKELNFVHDIKIKTNSKLYDIFNTDVLKVNSRHKSVIKNTDLDIVATSEEGYIEAVEAANKKFFIGVQWHPESMICDEKQNKIFENFINYCK